MPLFKILILAIVQGLAELLPVSSSAHVIVAEKLLGLDPTSPQATLLLVTLHSGTMLAVMVYFRAAWSRTFMAQGTQGRRFVRHLVLATLLTACVGLGLKTVIERVVLHRIPGAEIEMIFGNLVLIAAALAAVGGLILLAGRSPAAVGGGTGLSDGDAGWIGLVQGLCLPFRGFSRSGATISTGLLRGVSRARAEEFSFALAVILTPPVLYRECHRLARSSGHLSGMALPCLFGLACSFAAGLIALRWLSSWLETGKWSRFGIYCLMASVVVLTLHLRGY
nr:undecaprenyl-diphosphate phosphatase [uncultured Holophaga sp.]